MGVQNGKKSALSERVNSFQEKSTFGGIAGRLKTIYFEPRHCYPETAFNIETKIEYTNREAVLTVRHFVL